MRQQNLISTRVLAKTFFKFLISLLFNDSYLKDRSLNVNKW